METKSPKKNPLECYVLEEYLAPKPEPQSSCETPGGGDAKKKPWIFKQDRSKQLCNTVIDIAPGKEPNKCTFMNCKMMHDAAAYLAKKEEDLGETCFVYTTLGYCPRGLACRFSKMHIDENGHNLRAKEGVETIVESQSVNKLDKEVQVQLRKKKYNFSVADKALQISWDIINSRNGDENYEPPDKQSKLDVSAVKVDDCDKKHSVISQENSSHSEEVNDNAVDGIKCYSNELHTNNINGNISAIEQHKPESELKEGPPLKKFKAEGEEELDNVIKNEATEVNGNGEPPVKKLKTIEDDIEEIREESNDVNSRIGPAPDDDLIRLRPEEKKKLIWDGKSYLAPLTTVGNLPFRRLCKGLGADITCGEMALGLPLLQGHNPEWALLKKHASEDFFGVQVCGCSPGQMSRVAQLLEEYVECDFVDINLGCPIDLIYKKGMGSAMMARKRPLEAVVRSMSSVLSRPLTVKMRTGIYSDKNTAHTLFPLVREWGAQALTLHGRSREMRYTKLADWQYIGECARTVPSLPVFGNGDVMNYEDYNLALAQSGVAGVMVGRGALIKPWLFTEIKEQRHWDIQAGERLDLVRDFCNYGLEHWGSDDKGVENTRKFLLEWLSFTHRYVPHGILLHPPQRINERTPYFRGRNELETLLSSSVAEDWVKISEMFLGKVKPGFSFNPKHRANSYS